MLQQVLQLPLIDYWLPLAAGVPMLAIAVLLFARGGRGQVDPAPTLTHDPFLLGSSSERRTVFRRGGTVLEILYTDEWSKERPQRGYVIDRSVKGLRMVVNHELTAGTTLSVRPAQATEIVPWVEMTVRACDPSKIQAGAFDVGCEFVKSPPYSILLLFG